MNHLNNTKLLSESVIDNIADAIVDVGYVLVDDFLCDQLASDLLTEVENLKNTEFRVAGIGRNENKKQDDTIRADRTLWLADDSNAQSSYLSVMQQLQDGVNRRLFMGLFDFECHFSIYSKGDFYLRHLDAFKGRSNRALSTVFYLNKNWDSNDGGELLMYADEQANKPLLKVTPRFNKCVIFLSDTFPHEVLVSNKDRYSIAGWYRVNSHGQLDPSQ